MARQVLASHPTSGATGLSTAQDRSAAIRPVQRRLLAPLAAVLVLLVGGFVAVLLKKNSDDLQQASHLLLADAVDELADLVREQSQSLESLEVVLLHDKAIAVALNAGDRDALQRSFESVFAQLRARFRVTHFYFHQADRVNLLRLHNPERNGDLIDRFTMREAERTGEVSSGIELGPMGTFTLRVVMPVLNAGTLVGYIELGKEIEDILVRVGEERGIQLVATIHKTHIQRELWEAGMEMLGRPGNWNRFPGDAVIYSSMARVPEAIGQIVDRDPPRYGTLIDLEIEGDPWSVLSSPLTDAAGNDVGELFACEDVSKATAQFHRLLVTSSGMAILVSLVLVAFLYFALRRVDLDITKNRKQLLVATEEAEAYASELETQKFALDQHSIVAITDLAGEITYANDKFCQISQFAQDELIGQDHRMMNSGHHPSAFFGDMWRTIVAGDVWHGEIRNRAKDGSRYWADTTIVPFMNAVGRITRYVSIGTDITEQKKAETGLRIAMAQAEAANRAKSEFLANMSHEIRTPMTAILGFAENLLDTDQSTKERLSCVQTIRRNGNSLLGIINDILDLSKIEAGKMSTERIACEPCTVIAGVLALVRIQADTKGLSLDIAYAGPIPKIIHSDPVRLRQILINLIGNAIKFTDTGAVRLVTRLVDYDGEPRLQFDVIDSGRGMTEEQVGNLFQPFTQADNSTTRKFGGSGLGLTISKRLAAMLGGDIMVVHSGLGVGSTFRLTVATGSLDGVLMLQDPMSATVVTEDMQQSAHASQVDLHGVRVLLAEDGPDNQKLIAFVLTKAGADVTVRENGKLAVDAALAALNGGSDGDPERPYDVILMDMQMPVMDGYEATVELRRNNYTQPIIALTAHAMAGDREKCIEAGCSDYTTKPVDRKKLIALVREHADPSERPAERDTTPAPGKNPLNGCRILLAEDSLATQVLVVGILEKAGAEMAAVKDGKLALDAVFAAHNKGQAFDVVLMDIQMPLMGGDEAAELLRERGYKGKIISLTANKAERDGPQWIRPGFNDSVWKPIHRVRLIETIRRQWRRAQAPLATLS